MSYSEVQKEQIMKVICVNVCDVGGDNYVEECGSHCCIGKFPCRMVLDAFERIVYILEE